MVATEASEYARRNCTRYFEFQYVWPEIMVRTEGDSILRNALLRSVVRCSEEGVIEPPAEQMMTASIDAGLTKEVRLNVSE